MKVYIDFNTQLRTKVKNDFEKDFYKLMNNSVFGKTMESVRKHRNIKLVMSMEAYLKTVMKPNFKSGVLFGENLMGCEMGKVKVVMNKPIYLGQAILDLSKIIMYEFHYDYMIPKYGEKLNLCYMNSLIYNIETENFYKDIADDVPARFDTSGYLPNRPLPIGLNKKVIGLMKDELGLFSGETSYRSQLMFRSSKHKIQTLEINKITVNKDDDKRITIDGIKSLARGHYRT